MEKPQTKKLSQLFLLRDCVVRLPGSTKQDQTLAIFQAHTNEQYVQM